MSDLLGPWLRRRGWPSWSPALRTPPRAGRMNAVRGALVLETARLRLRELTVGDAPFVLRLLNDPSFLRYIGDRGVRDLEDARRYIVKGMIDSYERHGFGLWLVETREADPVPIGLCGLVSREGLDAPDIGFALLPEWWSLGLAHEAASAVMAHSRRVVGLERVLAIANPDNLSSVRLLQKLGFRYDRRVQIPGDPGPVALFTCEALRPPE